MAVFSCLRHRTIPTSCIEYVHPWTDSCRDATLGLLIHAFGHSLRTYISVYLFTMILRRKKITKKRIRETILGILQSTVFLTTHSYGFSTVLCTMRRLVGHFDKYSVAFTPAFLSSLVAIHLERPSRRPILCLYVTNIATETLFRMAVWRGWIKPIKYGQVIIFTLSASFLLYLLKSDSSAEDSMFSLLQFVIGPYEAEPSGKFFDSRSPSPSPKLQPPDDVMSNSSMYNLISNLCQSYTRFINLINHNRVINFIKSQKRSPYCSHPHSCIHYTAQGFGKCLAVGYGVQVVLRLVLSAQKIIRNPSTLPNVFFNKKVLNLGAFLGLFSGIYRSTSCALRWLRECDSEYHAIPAGLLAGLTFWFYPDNTAALYVMWKAIQILYNKLIEAGYLPDVPHGTVILYSFSTAVLFHAALLEPQNLRSSYYRFLYGLSGGRIAKMNRIPLDHFQLQTSIHQNNVVEALKLNPNPIYKFKVFGNTYPKIIPTLIASS